MLKIKRLLVILVLLTVVFSAMPVSAANYSQVNVKNDRQFTAQVPVVYKSIINVTKNGGVYQVGFVTIKIPKDFIDKDQLPIKITVKISAVNGEPGIEFTPDIPKFNKKVAVYVHSYKGLLYDSAVGKNIWVRIKQNKFEVEHFSRYAFS